MKYFLVFCVIRKGLHIFQRPSNVFFSYLLYTFDSWAYSWCSVGERSITRNETSWTIWQRAGEIVVFYCYFGNFETSLIIYHTQIPDNQMTVVGGGCFFCLFVILVWEEAVWGFLLFIWLVGWFYYKFNSKINVVNAKTEGESICSFKFIWSRTFSYAKKGIIRKWIINKDTQGHKPGGQMI